ncbi:MAG: PLP-dependent transferase [Tractidigestivibacter sp.]
MGIGRSGNQLPCGSIDVKMAEGEMARRSHLYCGSVGPVRAWAASLVSSGLALQPVEPLAGFPISCTDVREKCAACHKRGGRALVALGPCVGSCPAIRLGADLAWGQLTNDRAIAWLADDAAGSVPIPDGLLAPASSGELELLDCLAKEWASRSDSAQVVASYLACHPRVSEVRYPGLRQDLSFSIAARTLERGFGPIVDYRTRGKGEGGWRRYVATADDPFAQVMELERLLA